MLDIVYVSAGTHGCWLTLKMLQQKQINGGCPLQRVHQGEPLVRPVWNVWTGVCVRCALGNYRKIASLDHQCLACTQSCSMLYISVSGIPDPISPPLNHPNKNRASQCNAMQWNAF